MAERNSFKFIEAISKSLRAKILLAFFGVAMIPLTILSVTLYRTSANSLMDNAFANLDAVRAIKSNQVKDYFGSIENQVKTFSEDAMIVDNMRDMKSAFRNVRVENDVTETELAQYRQEVRNYYSQEFGTEYEKRTGSTTSIDGQLTPLDDDSVYLQHLYISGNPNPLGSKEVLDAAKDNSEYSKLHGELHPIVRSYLQKFGYYDIFLCDIDTGDIVYSVFKELDYSTSLSKGPYASTNFGKAFQQAADANSPDDVFLVDYEPYKPSYDAAASFISTPIFDGNTKIGVAIFQMPIEKINGIMAERTGLGESGETYAVGSDHLFRNDSRFIEDLGVATTIINSEVPVKTEAVLGAFNGESGTKVIDDYRGSPVLSSWTPIEIYNGNGDKSKAITWALMSEIDFAEVNQPVNRMAWWAGGMFVFATVLVGSAGYYISTNITKQTGSITDMLGNIGIGDFDARAEIVSEDELGQVAVALNAMCDNTLGLIQSADERERIEESIRKLQEEMSGIAGGDLTSEAVVGSDITAPISRTVNEMVHQLRQIIQNVKAATMEVGTSAMQIQVTTSHLSKGSEAQSSQIVDTSAAIEEMAASIQKVAESTAESEQVALNARTVAGQGTKAVAATIDGMSRIRDQVQETSKRIKRLGESSQEVGEIVELIRDIADRTSILALNASIQAAMAGDAGQGFAVVAEEVERLAERSNEATKQIGSLIKAIQTETNEAIAGMEESTKEVVAGSKLASEAGETLTHIDQVSAQLAELIGSISQNTKQQARGADAVAKSMHEISEVTQQTATGTNQAAVSVSQLATMAESLRDSVSQFLLPEGELEPASKTVSV
ncbi:MAG: HAMP domain-containing protein [Planctomicrobium sp.]|jgi:methyl-accepting chemotaxis protein|nr:HAMP domain-containing protein [Planctomicrobium sp.]